MNGDIQNTVEETYFNCAKERREHRPIYLFSDLKKIIKRHTGRFIKTHLMGLAFIVIPIGPIRYRSYTLCSLPNKRGSSCA